MCFDQGLYFVFFFLHYFLILFRFSLILAEGGVEIQGNVLNNLVWNCLKSTIIQFIIRGGGGGGLK